MSQNDGLSFSTTFSQIAAVSDRESLDIVMKELAAGYGLKSAAYFGIGLSGRTNDDPFLAVTYSSDWVEHYKERRFLEIDPVVQTGFRRLLPLDWDGFARTDEKVRTLFGEATEFGLGRKGISIPIHGRHGDRGILSITSDFSDRDWAREKLLYLRDFQVLATHIHDKVLRLEGQRPMKSHLSPRELECLQWIAEGKTVWECATILGLSQHTVRCYLESTRHKLNATSNTHAVSIAHRAGLLLPPL
ncbi:LuxR family transcriptional regulator [Notoacmeibacter sp. MSK16QG-6]|uniref:LuxR family transcriptional regulator n=1 Tax=Notoacmeibacter sp. MSK16QG-6 TaxID=2957982 RepID=UPI0020A1AEBA|nr:LuxR family transcriptional regulator [Notoacmeibacter sp. MSK16QG-6]MCP1201021.1 LuxR family transcriptional regulator [Notoacmeibacter sp. MSK16QG-6]